MAAVVPTTQCWSVAVYMRIARARQTCLSPLNQHNIRHYVSLSQPVQFRSLNALVLPVKSINDKTAYSCPLR